MKSQTKAPDATELLARAEEMVPVLRERATRAEEERRQPDETISDFRDAGFFTAMVPAEHGGSALSLNEFSNLVRTLARGDASAGWIGAFLVSHSILLYRYGAEAQSEFFAEKPYGLASGVASPPGLAEPAPGGYRLTGRWRFASGILHSEWVLLAAMSPTGPVSAALPVSEVEVIDTWFVPGMRGTGSNDVRTDSVFVPAHRVLDFGDYSSERNPGATLSDYPPIRYPVSKALNLIHSAVALGTADAALELFTESIGSRTRPQNGHRMIDEPITQQTFGKAWDLVHVAGLQLADALAVTDRVCATDAPPASLEDRARINIGVSGSAYKAFQAIDLIVRASGASIFRSGHPLERISRDTQVMRNHAATDFENLATVSGGVLLGAGLGDFAEPMF